MGLERGLTTIARRAADIGMKVNVSITQLLWTSPNNGCCPKVVIDMQGGQINSDITLKLVGFTFEEEPSVGPHVHSIVSHLSLGWMLFSTSTNLESKGPTFINCTVHTSAPALNTCHLCTTRCWTRGSQRCWRSFIPTQLGSITGETLRSETSCTPWESRRCWTGGNKGSTLLSSILPLTPDLLRDQDNTCNWELWGTLLNQSARQKEDSMDRLSMTSTPRRSMTIHIFTCARFQYSLLLNVCLPLSVVLSRFCTFFFAPRYPWPCLIPVRLSLPIWCSPPFMK